MRARTTKRWWDGSWLATTRSSDGGKGERRLIDHAAVGARIVEALGEGGARELLDVLTRSEADRAALIGRLHVRDDGAWLTELLVDIEVDVRASPRLVSGLTDNGPTVVVTAVAVERWASVIRLLDMLSAEVAAELRVRCASAPKVPAGLDGVGRGR